MPDKAEILIFKVAAAQRQPDAAIRMYFGGEDELAIYTVASAAHRILRDLMEKRGRSSVADMMRDSIQEYATQLASDSLPDDVQQALEQSGTWEVIAKSAELLKETGDVRIEVTAGTRVDLNFWGL